MLRLPTLPSAKRRRTPSGSKALTSLSAAICLSLFLGLPWSALSQDLDKASEDELLFFGMDVTGEKVSSGRIIPNANPGGLPSRNKVKKSAAEVKVLLLDLPNKSLASAKLTPLKATASQSGTAAKPILQFSTQTESLTAAATTAVEFLCGRMPTFPDGLTVSYSIGEGYAGHERDAAALPSAVLLESIATGRELDPNVALVGGMQPNGMVSFVFGIGIRLRTLNPNGIFAVGIPLQADPEVRDLALMNDFDTLSRFQILGLATLDDALAVADIKRPEKLTKAMELFVSVQKLTGTTPLSQLIKNTRVQERLKEILALAPNHLSAKHLLAAGTGTLAGQMTYLTSQQAILKACKPFWDAYTQGRGGELRKTAIECGNSLVVLQPHTHPLTVRYCAATRSYLRLFTNYLEIRPEPRFHTERAKMRVRLAAAMNEIKLEAAKLQKIGGTPSNP